MQGSVRLWLVIGSVLLPAAAHAAPDEATRTRVLQRYGELPLSFERNRGQHPAQVRFSARGAGYSLFLTGDEAVLQVAAAAGGDDRAPAVIRGKLLGARAGAAVVGEGRMTARAHYLVGRSRARWRRSVPLYRSVRYRRVLPGVDMVYHGNQGQLEYDFIVAPAADPASIRVRYRGMERAEEDGFTGDLRLHTAAGVVTLRRPQLYQEIGARRVAVTGAYLVTRGDGWADVSFAVGDYDRKRPLVIDPIVSYSTYLGSYRGDGAAAVAVDPDGSAYVTGSAGFANFPTTPGAFQPVSSHTGAGGEVFVSKLAPDGRTLVYSTYLGGSSYDHGHGIAVDAAGSAYVTGYTGSADFPLAGSLQPYAGGGSDVFVSKLTADGSGLVYSTFVGGSNPTGSNAWDHGEAIAVNHLGQAYVTGRTGSSDFPTRNAAQSSYGGEYSDAFVLKLAANGRSLIYSTFLGGSDRDSGYAIAVIPGTGAVFVTGSTGSADFPAVDPLQAYGGGGDAFVSQLRAGGELAFSSHLGGGQEDLAEGVAVDGGRRAVVAGRTYSDDFPLLDAVQGYPACTGFGCQNGFVTRLRADLDGLNLSTYLGGSDIDVATAVAVDGAGDIYVSGQTYSNDFPVERPVQHCAANRGQLTINADAFVVRLSGQGTPGLSFASCLGGSGNEAATAIAVDAAGAVYLAGWAGHSFPTTAGSFQPALRRGNNPDPANNLDAFAAKLIQEVDAEPDVVEFTQPVFNVYEDQGVAYLRVSRTGSGFGQVQVRVLCSDGTAVAGEDYDDIDGGYALSWSNGQTGNRRHTILVTDDGPGEGIETVNCTLEAPAGSGLAVLGTVTTATLRIRERELLQDAARATAGGPIDDSEDPVAGEGGCQLGGRTSPAAGPVLLAGLFLLVRRRRAPRAR